MDIKDLRNATPPTPPTSPVRPVSRESGESQPQATNREDTVDISAHARSLADGAEESDGVPQGTLAPDRLLELRRRIQAGDHNSPEMIRAMARGIVARGDL